jgi:hypothetical protein
MTDEIYESEAKGNARPTRAGTREAGPRQSVAPSGPRLRRRRRSDNLFNFRGLEPPGYTYEWKTESIFGAPNSEHMIDMRENHWRPVPAARHPDRSIEGETIIRRGGSILMERPSYLTEEARMEDINEAMAPVKQMEEIMYGTPSNTLTRNHPSVRKSSYVRRQYSPGPPINEGEEGGLDP